MGVGARPSDWTWTRACALLVVALALVAVGAHGARTGPRGGAPAHCGGNGMALARRSLLSQPGVSCCTHDPNTEGSSCCPHPLTP
ncbi:hypothetical protein HU200_048230 [Digitaria exilis]|uniref:Uncharacterized protein n=1 Tax=Digitaria exilis TaxID=1010633 RepID=A0A835AT41_9POAL|nr:hypothetical protein HU200_048230 [Digitaria exilis]